MHLKTILLSFGLVMAGSAFAGNYFVPPADLQATSDGAGVAGDPGFLGPGIDRTFENLLQSSSFGWGPDVYTVDGGSNGFGDQTDGRWFRPCGTGGVPTTVILQIASLAPKHAVGWYNVNDPGKTVTWVLGDVDGSGNYVGDGGPIVDSAVINFGGTFGLVFRTPTSQSDPTLKDIYGDDGTLKPLAVVQGKDQRDCELYLGWDDNGKTGTGEPDYNDLIMSMKNVEAVPEPFTMALAGLGLAAAARMRRRK